MPAESADVIVIGGGPAGSATALRLARNNLHVIQLERRTFHDPSNDRLRSGEGVIPRTLHELARLGISLDHVSWEFSHLRHLHVHWPDGTHTQDSLVRYGGIIQIDRENFDAHLFNAARCAGVDGREGWHVRGLERDTRGCVTGVLVQSPDGTAQRSIKARMVVDAGGRNALALRAFNVRRYMLDGEFCGIALFFDQVADLEQQDVELHLFNPCHLTTVVLSQLCPGVVRCGMGTIYPRQRTGPHWPQSFFWDRLRRYPELARRLNDSQALHRPFVRAPLGYRVQQVTFDGLLLAGDAAGYLSPLFGDGILRALVSARHAAHAIVRAFQRDDCSQAALAPYARYHTVRERADRWLKQLMFAHYRHPSLLNRIAQLPWVRNRLLALLLRH